MKKINIKIVINIQLVFLIVFFNISFSQIQTLADDTEPSKTYKFTWPEVRYANSYIVQLSKDSSFSISSEIYEFIVNSNFIEITLPFGIFYLRIAGQNSEGEKGPFSDVMKIIVEDRIVAYYDESIEIYAKPEIEDEADTFVNLAYIKIIGDPDEEIIEELMGIVDYEGIGDINRPLVFQYPDEICLNLFYYLGLSHYHHSNEEMAIFYFDLVKSISTTYEPEFIVEFEEVELSNKLVIKYVNPENFILDDVIVDIINEYMNNAKKFESESNYDKAFKYYKYVLSFDPYNAIAKDKVNYLYNIIKKNR